MSQPYIFFMLMLAAVPLFLLSVFATRALHWWLCENC